MNERMTTACCITGGGPAGIMLGFLLARAGVDVVVLEKHADFFRDFRGDTIHPSTLQLMHELGLLDAFLAQPHDEVRELSAQIGDELLEIADFTHLKTVAKFLALMPQWDFLNFLADRGKRYPGFHLLMEHETTDLTFAGDRVTGVIATAPSGPVTITADVVVGADGRTSIVREKAGLHVEEIGAPIDVLWMRMTRKPDDPAQVLGIANFGKFMIMLNRTTYWQCAFVIHKGDYAQMRTGDITPFREQLVRLVPWLRDRVEELRTWDDVKLLTVAVDRLTTWYRDGLLCIGDAAHAMSPIGGVGINLAVQDAVAAANVLAPAFARGVPGIAEFAAIQRRRVYPMKLIQFMQVTVQNRVLKPVLASTGTMHAPAIVQLFDRIAWLRRFPAMFVGIGPRPEHIRTPDIGAR